VRFSVMLLLLMEFTHDCSGTMLSCGLHACPSKCHYLADHSKMPCDNVMRSKCPKGHSQSWKCHQNVPAACSKCDREAKLEKEKQAQEFALQQKRDAEQLEYTRRLAELEQQILREQQVLKDKLLAEERLRVIQQKEKDLQEAAAQAGGLFSPLRFFTSNVFGGR